MQLVQAANILIKDFAGAQKIINQDGERYILVNSFTKLNYTKNYVKHNGKIMFMGYNLYGKNPKKPRLLLGTYDYVKEVYQQKRQLNAAHEFSKYIDEKLLNYGYRNPDAYRIKCGIYTVVRYSLGIRIIAHLGDEGLQAAKEMCDRIFENIQKMALERMREIDE